MSVKNLKNLKNNQSDNFKNYCIDWVDGLNKLLKEKNYSGCYEYVDITNHKSFNVGDIVETTFDDGIYHIKGFYRTINGIHIQALLGKDGQNIYSGLSTRVLKPADDLAKHIFNIFAPIEGSTSKRNELLL